MSLPFSSSVITMIGFSQSQQSSSFPLSVSTSSLLGNQYTLYVFPPPLIILCCGIKAEIAPVCVIFLAVLWDIIKNINATRTNMGLLYELYDYFFHYYKPSLSMELVVLRNKVYLIFPPEHLFVKPFLCCKLQPNWNKIGTKNRPGGCLAAAHRGGCFRFYASFFNCFTT